MLHQSHREHPSLSFLPFTLANVAVSDIYNGLILSRCRGVDGSYCYVVYNLTTKEFKELSPSIHSIGEAQLGFDPIASSHFHVIEYVDVDAVCRCGDLLISNCSMDL